MFNKIRYVHGDVLYHRIRDDMHQRVVDLLLILLRLLFPLAPVVRAAGSRARLSGRNRQLRSASTTSAPTRSYAASSKPTSSWPRIASTR